MTAQPAAPGAARARLPYERARITDSQHQVSLALPAEPTSRRAPLGPDDLGPLLDGNMRIVTLRGGWEDHLGVAHRAGHITQVPRKFAEAAARAGAVEIKAAAAASAPPAEARSANDVAAGPTPP